MSGLSNKNVLVIGDENTLIHMLEVELMKHGMKIHTADCENVTPAMVEEKQIDLILLNHLHEGETCVDLIKHLNMSIAHKVLPIFALVNDTEEKIQEALTLGAADYIVPTESVASIVQKVRVIFDDRDMFSGSSDIDISQEKPNISTTGIRVFVVEDDPLLRNLLSIRFEKSAFPYEIKSDGESALPAMDIFKPDIILLDLMLPGMSGFDILAKIKQNPQLAEVPVMIFSNRDSQEDRKKAKELGAVGFYVKAMTDLAELIEKIEELTK